MSFNSSFGSGEQPSYWSEPQLGEYNMSLPRAVRNRNPGNIRVGNNWKGEVPAHLKNDLTFEEFTSFAFGYRALLVTLRTYIGKHKKETLESIIYRWAPQSDGNYTEEYIRKVCDLTHFNRNKRFTVTAKSDLCGLAYAMSFVEAGKKYVGTFGDVLAGWELM